MLQTSHGGECCGIRHIHGLDINVSSSILAFTGDAKAAAKKELRETIAAALLAGFGDYLDANGIYSEFTGALEVVLANDQVRWIPILLEEGFKPTISFLNANTGNECTIYHKTSFSPGDYFFEDDDEIVIKTF